MVPAATAAAAWGSTRPLWMRLSASGSDCEVLQGTHRARQRQEKQAERENEAEMSEFEALGLLRTFVGGPAAAQWAMAGGAPAPQLNDRSRSRPQRGNGRERLPPPSRT